MTNPRDLVPSLRSFAAGLVALGDADRPSPFGTEARAESGVDGLANAASISDGGKDHWQRAIEGLLDSYDRSLSATGCRCRSTVLSHVPHLPLSVLTGNGVAPTAIG